MPASGSTAAVATPAGADAMRAAWRSPSAVALAAALAATFAILDGPSPQAVLDIGCAVVLVALAAIDVRRRILPNRIVMPAAGATLLLHTAIAPEHALEWWVASLGAAAFLLLPLAVHPAGMGLGDVKLAVVLGAWLGKAVLPAMLVAFVAVLPVALYLMARHGAAARRMAIPFGPFLAAGALVAALAAGVS